MIYAYRCTACSHDFEVVKRLAEIDRVETCPVCQSDETGRVVAGAAGFTTSESLGRRKAPAEFRDFLKTLHRNTPGSKMDID